MSLICTAAPAALISLEEIKAHLRVDHNDEDALITALIAAGVQHLDGRDGILGRALMQQSWELRLDGFCSTSIRIPLPPLISVDAVRYYDRNNVLQTLSTSHYEVAGIGDANPGYIRVVEGESWPDTRPKAEAVIIEFTAGYVLAASPTEGEVPAPIMHALKLAIGHWYANRESVSVGVSAFETPMAFDALIEPHRVHHFA